MIKILYISSVVPDTSCGSRIAIFRHLVQKDDFEVIVCSSSNDSGTVKNFFAIKHSRLINRLLRTRLSKLIWNFIYLFNWFFLSKRLLSYACSQHPDIIFTVPDDIHAGLAIQLARKLDVPLAVNFQDLFPISQFTSKTRKPFVWVSKILMQKFQELHDAADIAFYTSEGMQQWFGQHPNGHIL